MEIPRCDEKISEETENLGGRKVNTCVMILSTLSSDNTASKTLSAANLEIFLGNHIAFLEANCSMASITSY